MLSCDMDDTASINYRSTARKVVRHSNHKMRRDREPSRFQITELCKQYRKENREKKMSIIRKTIPKSSSMFMLATNFKVCYLKFVNRKNCFFSRFYNWLFTKSKHSIKQCIKNNSQ